MVLKIWCLLPARLPKNVPADWPAPPPAAAPDPADPLIPDGGIGESPAPPLRPKRSSFTTFFAFSSKRRPPRPDLLAPPATWAAGPARADSAAVPSPLRRDDDDDEYYYAYCASVSPAPRSPPASPGHTADSSPVEPRPLFHHPYAYAGPTSSVATVPPLRHAASQPFQLHPHASRSDVTAKPALGRPILPRRAHHLRASLSTPNLASGAPLARAGRRAKERWLSADTWWDALFSPSPRLKIKQAPCLPPASGRSPHASPVQTEPRRALGVSFPSTPVLRPRALSIASVISNARSTPHVLTRSRSAADIHGQAASMATPRTGFEPALEPLADERTPTEQLSGSDTLPPPDPPLSLEQVIDEREAFEQQRAQWKKQATRSIGNKHTRSISRARSKSLSERQARRQDAPEASKSHLALEFLAARTFLGSQSTMPTVHVTRPSNSSSHSKAHSHSHSAYSCTHTSISHGHSHSHSHSLATSNSSKSSRHQPPRGHSRAESWSKAAFLKAGSLCGIHQDESYSVPAEEKVPASSRVDVQSTDVNDVGASDTTKMHSPSWALGNQVGIAITSSPPPETSAGMSSPRRQERDRRSPKQKRPSFEYAGPHPSAIDSNLPPLGVASDVSLRHRLPPRAAIYPPIAPIAHPYRSASVPLTLMEGKPGPGKLRVATTQTGTDRAARSTPYPNISLSHADFQQYGVGEALVYASPPSPGKIPESEPAASANVSSSAADSLLPDEQSPSRDTILEREAPGILSSGIENPPPLTNSTIQMVMSAFDNPDDLDEFQDLFYRPLPAPRYSNQEPSVVVNQVSTDARSSVSNSPLTHLVRKLSEEVHGRRGPSRTPSDSIRLKRNELQRNSLDESETKFIFTDTARPSSSPQGSASQLHTSIEEASETATQPATIIQEDVGSSCATSVVGSPWADDENDTFGYPIRHGQLEAATPPPPVQSPLRVSTHLSIQENQSEEDHSGLLRPEKSWPGLSSAELARSSYLTTSDMSQMSGLSDFPLPPTARPSGRLSSVQSSSEQAASSDSHDHDETEMELSDEESMEPSGDVEETLRVLRMIPRATSYDSRRTTFGGSEDMDYIAQMHQPNS